MTAAARAEIPRADVVGSLLRPPYLREARQAHHEGRLGEAELRAAEDRAVLEAIELQEAIGLSVITDGEMRRQGWSSPLRAALTGFTAVPGGSGYRWRTGDPGESQAKDDRDRLWPFVTARVEPQHDVAQAEYPYLKAHAHTRTKYCLALSPQCGFASVEAGNPLTPDEQHAKLRLVAQIARRVWGQS